MSENSLAARVFSAMATKLEKERQAVFAFRRLLGLRWEWTSCLFLGKCHQPIPSITQLSLPTDSKIIAL